MRRLRHAAALAALIALLPGGAAARAAAPPPLQAIELDHWISLSLPKGVALSGYVELTPDERHLLVPIFDTDGSAQAAITDLDGSHYRCLTCGRASQATKLLALDDEKRLWFANNGNGQQFDSSIPLTGGTGDVQYQMLECAPSIYDCRNATIRDVTFPIDSLAQGAQNREAKPDPYGEYVAWNEVRTSDGSRVTIARLVRSGDGYALTGPRVVNPAYRETGFAADWVPGGRFYEGGDWIDGNRSLKYQATDTGLDYDTWTFSLQTGDHRQMTTDLDYNELGEYSPDGHWLWYSSARGLDRMTVFTALQRPSLLDGVAFGQIGRVSLWNNRRCMNEGWLMSRDAGQQRGGYGGQPVLLEDDWNLRQWDWFSDGRTALVQEERLPNRAEPTDPAQRVKLGVVRLPGLHPAHPLTLVHVGDEPWTRWTTPSDDYDKLADQQLLGHVLRGRAAGTVTLDFTGTFALGAWQATYRDYSDDGRTFLDGTESLSSPSPVVLAVWYADLREHGEHNGWLRGRVEIEPQNRFDGTAESVVDGVHRKGIPTQASCPGLHRPPLVADVVRRRRLPGDRVAITVRVTAHPAGDASVRPVQAARVMAAPGAAHARARGLRVGATSDAHGRAVLVLPRGPRPRTFTIRAIAGTFAEGTTTVDLAARPAS